MYDEYRINGAAEMVSQKINQMDARIAFSYVREKPDLTAVDLSWIIANFYDQLYWGTNTHFFSHSFVPNEANISMDC